MTIEIALLASQRLTDNPDGGGASTSTIVPDNSPDNLFGPISRINRANGNVSLRKAFVKALTADTKTFYGAHVIIAKPPTNTGVSALVFTTGNWTDERAAAVDSLESYLVEGPQTRLWPYGQQVVGARSILCYQPTTEPLPNIGETYVIVNQQVTPNVAQFVRVTSVTNTVQTFTDTTGSYTLNVVTMGISEPLAATYPGAAPQRYSTPAPPSVICTTNVADAANYFGVERLAADVSSGDTTCKLASIFGQLVPSSIGESPITNSRPLGVQIPVAASTAPFEVTSGAFTSSGWMFAGVPIMPGTLTLRDGFGNTNAVDDGAGNLCSGASPSGAHIGTVNYTTGFITSSALASTPQHVSCSPAGVVDASPFTTQQAVTQSTRGYLYNVTLNPVPEPGTTVVSYRALGRWYDLRDDGSGTLVGAEGSGGGTVRFDSGVCSATLGALPDIGSNVVFSWGGHQDYNVRTGDVAIEVPAATLKLANAAKPGTITVSWLSGITHSVTDDGAGNLTGYGTGTVVYGAGEITLKPTGLPSPADGYSVTYDKNPATTQLLNPSRTGSVINLTLPSAPIAPHSVHLKYLVHFPASWPGAVGLGYSGSSTLAIEVVDDGSGNLKSVLYGFTLGTVNYTSGAVSFNPDITFGTVDPSYSTANEPVWNPTASPPSYQLEPRRIQVDWVTHTATLSFTDGDPMTVISSAASATPVTLTETFPAPGVVLDLTPTTNQPIVPGSVVFDYSGDRYVDRSGALYRSLSLTNNAGTLAGTIDYQTGRATITDWNTSGSTTLAIKALLCIRGQTPIGYLSSRVNGQSVRPGSFYIQANRRTDGALISATADVDGNIATADMLGHIDVNTGFYSVHFGQLVLDSSLSPTDKAQPWYDPGAVDGTGHIWRSNEALPGTVRISCVIQTALPLSASVLGLDPVRLPSDGRVPIVRPGYTLVFREPLTYTMSAPLTAGHVESLPRGSLESVVLYDANAVAVDPDLYSVDLSAGTVTMATPLDLSAYLQPLVALHARADMVLCDDADITGEVSFSPALTHSYPAATSYVSSALIADNAGNLSAGVEHLFSQTTWNYDPTHLWADAVQGSTTTAQFDDINYPIQVLNRDTIKQRVALIFTSSTGGNIAFEDEGIVGTFTTSTNVAPINPATSQPYFVLDHRGFGSGWAAGNAIRFNLRGAGFPIWLIRSVQAGTASSDSDTFTLETRWDE